jgi:hypothetical protein
MITILLAILLLNQILITVELFKLKQQIKKDHQQLESDILYIIKLESKRNKHY